MSDRRRQEAREAKGRQFIWIKITFVLPSNYKGALGDEISVKRQWNRDGEMNTFFFPVPDSAGKQARLTRFLNEIDFTYIPAIKDMTVYADLIERMYGAAAETNALRDATTQFVDAIGQQTTSLSEKLTSLFGGPARLAPPTEMSRLFRDLDFAHGDDGHSLLRQKGDGVKARHLPELLRFINSNEPRSKFYLWGFEEPENSLDFGAAEGEAKRFGEFSGRDDTQVFITSHSPAFYLLEGVPSASVRRYFISKQEKSNDGSMSPKNAVARIDRLEDAESRMEQSGLLQLPFLIRKMGEQRAAMREKEAEAEALRLELLRLQRPTLFVEGTHDVDVFRSALARTRADDLIGVKPLGGTPQTPEALLSAVLQQGGLNAACPTMFLFDNDKAGRGAFRRLCGAQRETQPTRYQGQTFVWTLPVSSDFQRFMRTFGIKPDQAFFTAEFLYPADLAAQLCLELTTGLTGEAIDLWRKTIHGDYWHGLGQAHCLDLLGVAPGTPEWLFARGVPDNVKALFNEQAQARGLDTAAFDNVAAKARELLLPPATAAA